MVERRDAMAESVGGFGGGYARAMMSPAFADTFDVAGVRCHLVGIGGCGMSGLARMLRARGALVTGSEVAGSETAWPLIAEGFGVTVGQGPGTLPADAALVVRSAAVGDDHPEVIEARERGLGVMSYAGALGACMLGRTGVAVAGTHGKSTTSAMLGWALMGAGLDPTVIVGAACGQIAPAADGGRATGGFRLGSERVPRGALAGEPGVLVAEACEFNRSFHGLHPTVAAITGVEADHLDVYGTLDGVVEAFGAFARRLPAEGDGGRLLIAHEGGHRERVTAGVRCGVETIGLAGSGADWCVEASSGGGAQRVRVLDGGGGERLSFALGLPGGHMAMNAATAGVVALWMGAERGAVESALGGFLGVERRMQDLGELRVRGGVVRVWDDYGHHPTEVAATLSALREHHFGGDGGGRGGRLVCVFQPHQHSRTRFLLESFARSFSAADVVLVPEIYFVRDSEAERERVSAGDLVERLRGRGVEAWHEGTFVAIVERLRGLLTGGDVVVVMGAGPVWKVARGLMDGASV